MDSQPFLSKLTNELAQSPKIRQELLRRLSSQIGRTVITLFTSFRYPVTLDSGDADLLEEILHATNLHNGLCLVLNSIGGDSIAAERIVQTCRVYAKEAFDVLVPRRAKSAATLIALGADRILMGETSALGRIDPQVVISGSDGIESVMPADIITQSYDDLMAKATCAEGRLEPYLQQLSKYDAREIERLRRSVILAGDMATKLLKSRMLSKVDRKLIRKKIALFLEPGLTKAHGRDIYYDDVQKVGLNVELIKHDSKIWDTVSEIYVRSSHCVSSTHCKLIESPDHHFSLPWEDHKEIATPDSD